MVVHLSDVTYGELQWCNLKYSTLYIMRFYGNCTFELCYKKLTLYTFSQIEINSYVFFKNLLKVALLCFRFFKSKN